jgi:hypothetical protein
LSSVATPAHARVNQCATGTFCTVGGSGHETRLGGGGGRQVTDFNAETSTFSGGSGHFGGLHETITSSGETCVGSACP